MDEIARAPVAVPPGRVRHVCRGMNPDQRYAYFSEGGEGRKWFPKHVCDNELVQIDRKRTGVAGLATSLSEYFRQRAIMSPAERLDFLEGKDALKIFPSEVIKAEKERLTKERTRVRNVVCSYSWYRAAWRERLQHPPGGDDTGMYFTAAKVRWGDGPLMRRWIPKIAARVEYELDTCEQPGKGEYPFIMRVSDAMGSPSAQAILTLRTYRVSPNNAREVQGLADDRGRIGRKRGMQGRKKAAENKNTYETK